jgi:hypothetical protein
MRRRLLALALVAAGCLGTPPGAIAPDAGDGDDARPPVDAGCPVLPPLAPFADDFSTGALDWVEGPMPGRSGPGDIDMTVEGGELRFVPGATADDHAWLQSSGFDFSSGRVAARIRLVDTDPGAEPYFGIIGPGPIERMLRFHGAAIEAPSGTEYAYAPEDQLWWQVTSDDGRFRYQVSPNGIEWTDLEAAEPGFTLADVIFEVGVNVESAGVGDRGTFVIDDLDLPPCR